jgi:HAMP domain-containing protein
MFKNLKLGTRFSLILAVVFAGGLVLSGAVLSAVLESRAQQEVADRATVLMQVMHSVRSYTNTHITPLLTAQAKESQTFLPEMIPTYSAIETFETLRKQPEYADLFYKEATPNPTNLRDKADSFETALVERFRGEAGLKELTGLRDQPGGRVFYIARPLKVSKASCLQCHSTPEAAPKSLINTYGPDNGFGWKEGEIVAAQIVSVPIDEVYASANRTWVLVLGVLVAVFGALLVAVNLLLRRTVIERIGRMASTADAVSTGNLSAEFSEDSSDEIGTLATAFNRMKSSLEIALKMLSQRSA